MPCSVHPHVPTSVPAGETPPRTAQSHVPPAPLLRSLQRAHVQPALQCLARQLHIPPSGIYTEHRPRAHCDQIGHNALHTLRPVVTPFLGQHERDITQLVGRGATCTDPIILPAAIGCVAGPAGVTGLWSMWDQSAQRFAIRALPRPRQRKPIA